MVRQGEGDQNFHAFYYLLKAPEHESRAKFSALLGAGEGHGPMKTSDFNLVRATRDPDGHVKEGEEGSAIDKLTAAMESRKARNSFIISRAVVIHANQNYFKNYSPPRTTLLKLKLGNDDGLSIRTFRPFLFGRRNAKRWESSETRFRKFSLPIRAKFET